MSLRRCADHEERGRKAADEYDQPSATGGHIANGKAARGLGSLVDRMWVRPERGHVKQHRNPCLVGAGEYLEAELPADLPAPERRNLEEIAKVRHKGSMAL